VIANGTKRKCAGGDHQVVYSTGPGEMAFNQGWHHQFKADWIDNPHKAAPRKYKKAKKK